MKVQSVNEVIFLSGLLLVQGSTVMFYVALMQQLYTTISGENNGLMTWIMQKYLVLISVPDSQLSCRLGSGLDPCGGQS